jgi:hypothetical protein
LILSLQIAGALQLLLALAHFAFIYRLEWREELQRVGLFTRQVFWVHTGFLMLVLVGFGVLDLVHADELLERTALARTLLASLTIFWVARLYCQFFVYRAELWRGHAFNTRVHVLFSALWTFLATVHAIALWLQWSLPNRL